ncbi:MCE family protein [Gordonia polyisoprenivorans]|nr:MCE family protein [Gordonia polyisoprenivorans]
MTAKAVVTTMVVLGAAGCSLNPGVLATNVQSTGSEEGLTIQFDTVLNLTDGADVNLNGIKVGHVKSVSLGPRTADAVVAFDNPVAIPKSARAAIRQATVLGDSFVEITTASAASNSTQSGTAGQGNATVIPVEQTTSPPPLENTLAVLANFVNGGSIQSAQDVLRMVNRALPSDDQTQRVASIVHIDSRDLAAHTSSVDETLRALTSVSSAINSRASQINEILSPVGVHYWNELFAALEQLGIVIPSVGSVFAGGYWLVPMLTTVKDTVWTARGDLEAVGQNEGLIRQFLTENLLPFVRRPDITIVSASTPDGRNVVDSAEKIFRMLGAIR